MLLSPATHALECSRLESPIFDGGLRWWIRARQVICAVDSCEVDSGSGMEVVQCRGVAGRDK
jgi:hypothetical protein